MAAIETRDLTRRFRRLEAVNGLDLEIPEGRVVALIGPNGAGKTTTIKLLLNLLQPTRGEARILGVPSRRLGPDVLQRIGYVSENQHMPEWMSPAQLLAYCRPLYPAWDDGLCRRLQEALGLTSQGPLRQLSRGTRMKTALLSSLAYRPELVILDEPFSGLDPVVRDELSQALLEAQERRSTVLISSHDVEEVERLADTVAFLAEGRLILVESVESLIARFRLVEVIAQNGETPRLPDVRGWFLDTRAGRTLRFIDAQFRTDQDDARLAAAFPGAAIQTSPLSLRQIFLTLARTSRIPLEAA